MSKERGRGVIANLIVEMIKSDSAIICICKRRRGGEYGISDGKIKHDGAMMC